MAVKEFNRFGLRRDNNFSDLPSPSTALNNILNTPTMLGNEESFTVTDLEPIQGIYVTNITTTTFNSLDGVTVSFTVVVNGVIDNTQNPKVYRPLIKIKNRLDTAYFSTGEPFFLGGDGPTATYYDSDKIIRNPEFLILNKVYPVGEVVQSNGKLYVTKIGAVSTTQLNHSSGEVNGFIYAGVVDNTSVFLNRDYESITGEDITISDNFWERGQFIYGNKVQNSFISLFGGVNWKGLYKPTVSGRTTFWLRTTGSTVFKFQSPDSPSYVAARYGKPSSIIVNSTWPDTAQKNALLAILNDSTRSLIEVRLEESIRLKDGDIVYLEVNEGPVISKQYRAYTFRANESEVPMFWIEVTEDFNALNLNVDDLPVPASGISYVTTGGGTSAIVQDQTPIAGYQSNVRYIPYDRRQLKTYVNSIYHKYPLIQGTFTVNNATSFTMNLGAEFQYYQMMINDYIYDYRLHGTESQGVRRWIITGLNDSTKRVTVELDTNYNINPGNKNDQQAYIGANGSLNFTGGSEIDTVYSTGAINDTISASGTQELYYVGRYGELTPREKYIAIEQFLENYVDYAFDWLYYTKDEDVDPIAEKAWLIWQQNESTGFGPLNYKYLYDKDYKFYEIGDFKKFVDNSVPGGGTSREFGIEQRAFGKPQLLTKGDQYNTLFTLLPLQSIYTPQENWNKVALERTSTLISNSRLVVLNNTTDVEIGNYLIQNTDDGFIGGGGIPLRTRIIQVLLNTNSVVTSRPSVSSGSVSSYVFDHRGFVTSGKLEEASIAGNEYHFYGDGSEIQLGMCVVLANQTTRSSYIRVTRIEYDSNALRYNITLDTNGIFNAAGQSTLCAIYYDRGIDITKPLEYFCTDTGCAQNNYNVTSDTVSTKYIALLADTQTNSTLDARWTEGSLTGSYNGVNDPNRITFTNGSASVSWWSDAYPNQTGPNMSQFVGGTTTQAALNNGYTVSTGNPIQQRKRYGGGVVYAQFAGSQLAAAIQEEYPNYPVSTYTPVGFIEGVLRIKGDIRSGGDDVPVRYYYIVRVFDRIQSIPHNLNGIWEDGETLSDGSTKRGYILDLTKYPSSDFNITNYGLSANINMTLPYQGTISTYSQLSSIYTAYVNDAGNGYVNTADRIRQITANITLTANEATTWFYNPSSFVSDNGDGTVSYVIPAGTWFKTYSTSGTLMWFYDFEDIQDTETLFMYRPANPPTDQSNGYQDMINIYPQDGPVKITSNSWGTDQYEFLHYRRKQYEMTPMPTFIEDRYPGIRMINELSTNANVDIHLQNSVNKLSVYTFAQTTDNRELCCPPIDTSPPFDSSAIGLSTTTTEPDMSIGGLVNVRSIAATHPKDKIYGIPSQINGQAPNTQLPVNKKLGIVFGGVEYDLLIGDSKPF